MNFTLFQCKVEYFISLCNSFEIADEYSAEAKDALKALAKNDKERSAIGRHSAGHFRRNTVHAEIRKSIRCCPGERHFKPHNGCVRHIESVFLRQHIP